MHIKAVCAQAAGGHLNGCRALSQGHQLLCVSVAQAVFRKRRVSALLLLHRGCCRGCRQRADPRELLWCRDLPPAAWQGRCQEASSPRKAGGHNPESSEQQGTRARRTDSVSNTTMPATRALTEQQLCSLPHCSSARCIHQVSSLWAEPTGNKLPAEARPGEGERAGPLEGGYLVASLQA